MRDCETQKGQKRENRKKKKEENYIPRTKIIRLLHNPNHIIELEVSLHVSFTSFR